MSTLEMKQELVALINAEENPSILEAIRELFTNKEEEIDPVLKEKVIARALKAEEDIKAGRVYSEDEFYKRLDDLLKK